MNTKQGITLIELIVVLVIIAVTAAIAFPSFTSQTERAYALTARNNLQAIYSAQQNFYNNNNSAYCLSTSAVLNNACTAFSNCGGSLAEIDCSLGLNFQDDGTYTYSCSGTTCTATRSTNSQTLTISLNAPALVTCNLTNANWCP